MKPSKTENNPANHKGYITLEKMCKHLLRLKRSLTGVLALPAVYITTESPWEREFSSMEDFLPSLDTQVLSSTSGKMPTA